VIRFSGCGDLRREAGLGASGRMNTQSEHSGQAPGSLFFAGAAWYSFLVPLFAPVIWFLIVLGSGFFGAANDLGMACTAALCLLATSLIAGIVSLVGILRHRRKPILWVAVLGIITSSILGFISYGYWELSQNWHG
jgi:hypothetical protein